MIVRIMRTKPVPVQNLREHQRICELRSGVARWERMVENHPHSLSARIALAFWRGGLERALQSVATSNA